MEITVTDAQMAVLAALDPRKSADAIVQIHVDTWLAPLVAAAERAERALLVEAVMDADARTRESIKASLGIMSVDAVSADGIAKR